MGYTKRQLKARAAAQRRYAAKMRQHYPEWAVWKSMKIRCYQKSHSAYPWYGGKGVTVCDRWMKRGSGFWNFYDDMKRRPSPRHDLDRRDPAQAYSPDNCRWLELELNRGHADEAGIQAALAASDAIPVYGNEEYDAL